MKKPKATRKSPRKGAAQPAPERTVPANVILKSASGKSPLEPGANITPQNVKQFLPTQATLGEARRLLVELGFQIDLVADTHISI
jgi:hypothetical protein